VKFLSILSYIYGILEILMDKSTYVVMVIEDEEILLQAICKKFEVMGRQVIPCASGEQALEHLQKQTSVPNAIWLDYYLKDMNGLEFMYELKKNPAWEKIPVLVVSNSASSEKVTQMMDLGVSKYKLKAESRLDDLIDTLDGLIIKK
jgi:CheY-like chemotaxis protein